MSYIYENTLVCKTSLLETLVHKLQDFVGDSLVVHQKSDDYSLISFDTNGDLMCYDDSPLDDDDYIVYENMDEDKQLVSMTQGRQLPLRISYLIKTKFFFKELSDEARQDLLNCIKYWCEDEVCYEINPA